MNLYGFRTSACYTGNEAEFAGKIDEQFTYKSEVRTNKDFERFSIFNSQNTFGL